jgi:biotin operon repressor
MSNPLTMPEIPAGFPLPDLGRLMTAIGHPMRWAILKVLADGTGYGVPDLAPLIKCSNSNITKHLQILKNCGIVFRGRGNLYYIVGQYNPNPGAHLLEFGHCILRLDPQPKA